MKYHISSTRYLLAACGALVLTGCGTFQLSSGAIPNSPKTQEQLQLDNLSCKDQAKLEANTAGRQTGAFLLGMTIVGAPVAFEMEKAKQREVYKSCMEAKGYRVLPPADQTANPNPNSNPPGTPQTTQLPQLPPLPTITRTATIPPAAQPTGSAPASQSVPSGKDEATQLQKLKELRERGLISDTEYENKRKQILDRM